MIKKIVCARSFGVLSITCVVCVLLACEQDNVVTESEGGDSLQTLSGTKKPKKCKEPKPCKPGKKCRPSRPCCGNGVIDPGEECDSGDNLPGAKVTMDGEITTGSFLPVLCTQLSLCIDGILPLEGGLEFNTEGDLTSALVILGDLCLSTKASGTPITSPDCPITKSVIPILRQGQTEYDPAGPPPGSVFQQADTTFIGKAAGGDLYISSISLAFGFFLPIEVTFVEDGTGSLAVDTSLGTADGWLSWTTSSYDACADDCTLLCGNGVIDPGEECDGTPDCDDDCTLLPYCSNGVIDPGEECDGGDNCTDDCTLLYGNRNNWALPNPGEDIILCFQNAKDCLLACLSDILPPEIADMLKQAHDDMETCIEENEKPNYICRKEFRIARREAMSSATQEQKQDLLECLKGCGQRFMDCLKDAIFN